MDLVELQPLKRLGIDALNPILASVIRVFTPAAAFGTVGRNPVAPKAPHRRLVLKCQESP
jgi:hypothetical protein